MAFASKERAAAYQREYRARNRHRTSDVHRRRVRAEREAITDLRALHPDEWSLLYQRALARHFLPSAHHEPATLVQLIRESTPTLEQMEGEVTLMRLDAKESPDAR